MTETIVVSTDGSALGNPNGPMGWAWADHAKDAGDGGAPGHEHDSRGYDAGGATNGTNQIGELCAVLEALRAHPGPQRLIIESDSQYAINCSTKWVKGWKRNGWKNSQKKPVKNRELVQAIDEEIAKRPGPVEFKWVKGHAGNAGNELVDELARTYAGDCRSGARDGYLPIEGWRSLLNSEYSRGTDVPPDVQLVLDGKADAASLRDGAGDGDTPAHAGIRRDATEGSRSATRAGSRKSLADMLAEPEGAPDYGDEARAGAEPATTPGARRIGDARKDTNRAAAATHAAGPAGTDRRPAQRTVQPDRHADSQQPRTAAPTPRPAPTGLTVSGGVRFSPAPKTSPFYTGEAMHVRGYIAVDGFVDGDGNLTLVNAEFLRG
ncbi:ribonuclease H family protein [Bifidobacterium platyrrhinorum]|uniref:ribonuclease H n=1 Tax=Bifidobacterium platyrrhinorum TaxID=2661628 RepID=A0A6L9SXV6_9BIFI|nr:ribonuclease H [Bifidobacterium platyrrhinorum]NEG55961.1 ribonuclease HI [Bifidobacterium platyrrhinorum]